MRLKVHMENMVEAKDQELGDIAIVEEEETPQRGSDKTRRSKWATQR